MVPVGYVRSGLLGFFGKFGMTGAGTKAYAALVTHGARKRAIGEAMFACRLLLATMLAAGSALFAGADASGQTYRQRRKEPPQPIDGLPDQIATRPTPSEAEQGRGGEKSPAARGSLAASSGQELVREAALRVYSLPSLQAQLRMKLTSQERQSVASGDYLQVGAAEEKLLKLHLKVPIGGKVGSIQQIRGPHYLWILRDLPPDEPQIERVILRTARLEIVKAEEAGRLPPLEGWILLGGLSRLLANLDASFEFGPPRQATLGDVPVLIVRGKWKPAALKRLTKAKPAELPEQLPHEVEITLGAADQPYPLFPYRIEYLRNEDPEQGRGEAHRSLALIEFFELGPARSVDRGQFEFDSEDRDIDDVTMSYLRRLGILPPKQ